MATWPSKPYGWFSTARTPTYEAGSDSYSFASGSAYSGLLPPIPPQQAGADSTSVADALLSVKLAADARSDSILSSDPVTPEAQADSTSDATAKLTVLTVGEVRSDSDSSAVAAPEPVTTVFDAVGNFSYPIPLWASKLEIVSLGGGGGGGWGGSAFRAGGGGAAGRWNSVTLSAGTGPGTFTPGGILAGVVGAGGVGVDPGPNALFPAGADNVNDGGFSGLKISRTKSAGGVDVVTAASGSTTATATAVWNHTAGVNDRSIMVVAAFFFSAASSTVTATVDGVAMKQEFTSGGFTWGTIPPGLRFMVFSAPIRGGATAQVKVTGVATGVLGGGAGGVSHALLADSHSLSGVASFIFHGTESFNGNNFANTKDIFRQGSTLLSVAATVSTTAPTWSMNGANIATDNNNVSATEWLTTSVATGLTAPGRNQDQTIQVNRTPGFTGVSKLVVIELVPIGGRGGGSSAGGGNWSVDGTNFAGQQWGYMPGNLTYGGILYTGGVTAQSDMSVGGVPGSGGSGSGGFLLGVGAPGGSGGKGRVWIRALPAGVRSDEDEQIFPPEGHEDFVHLPIGWVEAIPATEEPLE